MRISIYGERDPAPILQALERTGRCHVSIAETPEELAEALPDLEGLVLANSAYRSIADLLRDSARRLRWVQLTSSGFDAVLSIPPPPGVVVSRARGIWSGIVAEHALALALALLRGVPRLQRNRLERIWGTQVCDLRSMSGMPVLIVGYGAIGQTFGGLARQLGALVTAVGRTARVAEDGTEVWAAVQLGDFLPAAGLVLLCAPGIPGARPLLDRPALERLRPDAFIVNVGRGWLIEEGALCEMLAAGRIAGAALDVFETEPLPPHSPLWSLPNVILSPHIAGYGDVRSGERLGSLCADNLARVLGGRALVGAVAFPGGPSLAD